MDKSSKIYIAGHRGLVGSALYDTLTEKGYTSIITRTHQELDLQDSIAVKNFFNEEKPEYVFLAAAKVGGIMANNVYRAQFIYENIQIQNNVIHTSFLTGVKKLLFLGSSCVYPKAAPQPIKEEYLLTDTLEFTNEPYAIAKIAGMKMCEAYNFQYKTNFISVMPTNLFGPNDNFHLENSHVLPAMVRKMHLAKLLEAGDLYSIKADLELEKSNLNTLLNDDHGIILFLKKQGIEIYDSDHGSEVSIKIWGSGKPMREFLWSGDMADACVYVMENLDFEDLIANSSGSEIRNSHINIGSGKEISIRELAMMVKEVVGFQGRLIFDMSKPDGTMRKLLDISKLSRLGWSPKIKLREGIERIYRIYCENQLV